MQWALEGDMLSVLCVVATGAFRGFRFAYLVEPASLGALIGAHPGVR